MADCLATAIANLNDPVSNFIYVRMQGPSEFAVTKDAILYDWNVTGQLHEIPNPVLLTHGKYDTMRPPCVDALYKNIPRVWKVLMPHSAHASMIDDPRLMNDVIGEFLD